ncbi:MAG: gamma-glutamyl-gamma-aminobutyrate hydrolase family protein [Acidobacteriota bacterium]
MAYRPKIGLTMRLELETRRFYLGRDYSEALEASGALPVHIPLITSRVYIEHLLSGLDGLLLPGSDTDVDPSYYAEDPHPKLGRVVPEKDETELLVLETADRLGLPILAICYGMQALNVSRGGTLIQDIGAQLENSIKHEQGMPLSRNSHRIDISAGSHLYSLISSEEARKDTKVNSHHHQAIGKVGKNLAVTARARDGVVEAIEDTRDGRHIIGVQWHPELSWTSDELSSAIFDNFVSVCAKARRSVAETGVV